MATLSKSDFQLAKDCAKKLVYKKGGYPTSNDTNEYMEMLAQGGYIVGHMATLLYPEGIEIAGSTKEAVQNTTALLKNENIVLFEAAIMTADGKLIRVDILEKKGNSVHIIEVKAKSHESDDEQQDSIKKLGKYIDDVAYQYLVFKEAYPTFNFTCSLLMPDKSKRTAIDGLAGWFSIEKGKEQHPTVEVEELPAQLIPRFKKPEVVFKYENDVNKNDYLYQLKTNGILSYLEVTGKVLDMQAEIKNNADFLNGILRNGIQESDYKISKVCKGCEFNSGIQTPNGYKECWGKLADTSPHVFDLYYGGAIGHYTKGFYIDELIDERKTSLYDYDFQRFKTAKGEISSRGYRQILQIENTQSNEEFISDELPEFLNSLEYPLHFIDFETYTGALPFYKGMRPYELIAFQWSCHTIVSPGATPIHSEWFQEKDGLPNFDFAEALMKQIGTTGTPFMWATHENTVLRTISKQMEIFGYDNSVLYDWLIGITSDKAEKREGRFIDMNKLTLEHYFHPDMKGKTSIKKVLPAIWNNNDYLHAVPHFEQYAAQDYEGGIIDPYDTLMAGISFQESEETVVKGGTDAMRAYYRILFDALAKEQKEELKQQLLRYCELDTMAMVIIAYHWGLK